MRYLITFSYDGTNYYGYQKQPNKKTIQQEIEQALTKINSNKKVTINSSGRTDRGVHAINQKAHFDLPKDIEETKLTRSLNKLLKDDIYIKNTTKVKDNFHARYDVKQKEYMYIINIDEYNPIERNYIYQYNKKLDINKMKQALKLIEGTHDFKSLSKIDKNKENTTRTIYKTNIKEQNNKIYITITGNGFLREMVRTIISVLIEIGQDKDPNYILEIMNKKDRSNIRKIVPGCGLYLKNVYYKGK